MTYPNEFTLDHLSHYQRQKVDRTNFIARDFFKSVLHNFTKQKITSLLCRVTRLKKLTVGELVCVAEVRIYGVKHFWNYFLPIRIGICLHEKVIQFGDIK